MADRDDKPPRMALWLSAAGLLPALAGLALARHAPGAAWTGQMGVLLYASSVLAFIGGLWWGLALAGRAGARRGLLLIAGVALQLASIVIVLRAGQTGLPLALGGTALLLLGTGLVELSLARAGVIGTGWLRLRLVLSAALALVVVLTAMA